ncbi:MAG: hypothetical protein AAF526_02325, partial [Pseudomonadota bacterium]
MPASRVVAQAETRARVSGAGGGVASADRIAVLPSRMTSLVAAQPLYGPPHLMCGYVHLVPLSPIGAPRDRIPRP